MSSKIQDTFMRKILPFLLLTASCQQEARNVRMPHVNLKEKPTVFRLDDLPRDTVAIPEDIFDFELSEGEKEQFNQIAAKESDAFTFRKTKEAQQDFWKKMEDVSKSLGFEPYWLYRVMIAESGINAAIQNKDTQATGLIQFMPSTASMLGTTIEQLKNMSPQEQLDYVYKFYLPYKNKISDPIDLYIVTFYPYARNKPNGYVIGSEISSSYANAVARQNRNFDLNKDGQIHLGEYRKYVRFKVFGSVPDYVFRDYVPDSKQQDTSRRMQEKEKIIKHKKHFNSKSF